MAPAARRTVQETNITFGDRLEDFIRQKKAQKKKKKTDVAEATVFITLLNLIQKKCCL